MGISGLYSIKPRFVRSLAGLESHLVRRDVSADSLSYGAVALSVGGGAAIVAGHFIHPYLWFLVPVFLVFRLALNALDGSIARRTGTARPFGKVVNELCDRVSDAALLVPFLAIAPAGLVVAALVAVSLTSLSGLLGEVVGPERLSEGPMGKADRCAVVAVASVAAGLTGAVVPLIGALVLIALGALITVGVRLRSLHVLAQEADDVR